MHYLFELLHKIFLYVKYPKAVDVTLIFSIAIVNK